VLKHAQKLTGRRRFLNGKVKTLFAYIPIHVIFFVEILYMKATWNYPYVSEKCLRIAAVYSGGRGDDCVVSSCHELTRYRRQTRKY
jgi:hypothetical protein